MDLSNFLNEFITFNNKYKSLFNRYGVNNMSDLLYNLYTDVEMLKRLDNSQKSILLSLLKENDIPNYSNNLILYEYNNVDVNDIVNNKEILNYMDSNTSTYSNDNLFNIRKDEYNLLTGGSKEDRDKIDNIKQKINDKFKSYKVSYDYKDLLNALFNIEKKDNLDNFAVLEKILSNLKDKNYISNNLNKIDEFIKNKSTDKKHKNKSKDKKYESKSKDKKDKKPENKSKDKKDKKPENKSKDKKYKKPENKSKDKKNNKKTENKKTEDSDLSMSSEDSN